MATYEPGTVAIATVQGVPNVRVMRVQSNYAPTAEWASAQGKGARLHEPREVTDIRPLVVLDLALMYEGVDMGGWDYVTRALRDKSVPAIITREDIADQIEAQTKPPRIPEPGLWGVVEASIASEGGHDERHCFVRYEAGWESPWWNEMKWGELIDPVLIREGVTS